jgi:hypothetical protein
MIFFGIRGCLPIDVFNHDFRTTFGKDQDNGIVGPVTAEALGLKSEWAEF